MSIEYSDKEMRQLLHDEAASGIGFANMFIAVGAILLGFLLTDENVANFRCTLPGAVVITMIGVYATVCYANTHGRVRDATKAISEIKVPIIWGNALTEYLGIYLLALLIPTAVWEVTGDGLFLAVTAAAVIACSIIYHCTEFDLLCRIIPDRTPRVFALFLFYAVSIGFFVTLWGGPQTGSDLLSLVLLATLVILTAVHIRKREEDVAPVAPNMDSAGA
ncbi:MAG: hypothetical protein AAGG69_04020 [Pseudomonadota bacterium]